VIDFIFERTLGLRAPLPEPTPPPACQQLRGGACPCDDRACVWCAAGRCDVCAIWRHIAKTEAA